MPNNLPKIEPKEICKICGGKEEYFIHGMKYKSYDHKFQPCLETLAEAAYRTGYTDGYNRAVDKATWGPGWD